MLVADRVFGYIATVGRLSVPLLSAIMQGASFMRFPEDIAKARVKTIGIFQLA